MPGLLGWNNEAIKGLLGDFTTGISRLPYRSIGSGVDLMAGLLRPLGYNVERPIGSSDWLIDKGIDAGIARERTGTAAEAAGDVLGGLLDPNPGPEAALALKAAGLVGAIPSRGLLGTSRVIPSDFSRVQFPPPAAPKKLSRAHNVEKLGRIPGAPPHVVDASGEAAALDNYLRLAEYGAPAGAWYADESRRMLAMAGGRPGVADRAAGEFGVTSANTALGANAVAGVRGHNQAIMGAPVNTHMGANDRKIEEIHRGLVARLGPKIDPYVGHLSSEWRGKAKRAVHDVWDLRAWGYPDKVGAAGEAQHRWMDKMMNDAVAQANARNLGGRSDWDVDSLQAAAWTAQKAEELSINPADLAHGYLPFYDALTARLNVESMPSGELVSPLKHMSEPDRLQYHLAQESLLTTPEGGDVIAQQLGALTPAEGKWIGPGQWNDENNAVTKISLLAGPQANTKHQPLEASSRGLLESVGAAHGLLRGQADVGYEFGRAPASLTQQMMNMRVVDYGRSVDVNDLKSLQSQLDAKFGSGAVGVTPALEGRGFNIIVYDADKVPGKSFVAGTNEIAKSGGLSIGQGMHNSGGLVVGRDDWAYRPSEYLKKLDNPLIRERLDAIAPALATDIRQLMKDTPGKWDAVYTKTLEALSSGGLAEVEKLVKQGVLPAAVLGFAALHLQQGANDGGA